jgi:hypothetical protein
LDLLLKIAFDITEFLLTVDRDMPLHITEVASGKDHVVIMGWVRELVMNLLVSFRSTWILLRLRSLLEALLI